MRNYRGEIFTLKKPGAVWVFTAFTEVETMKVMSPVRSIPRYLCEDSSSV